jgi:uncharacterized 2Fe-2S/4Fe-4S cluster protein (DUF4445 family)
MFQVAHERTSPRGSDDFHDAVEFTKGVGLGVDVVGVGLPTAVDNEAIAIAAGFEALLHHAGKSIEDVSRIYLAGGFGNFMNAQSALKIGLLPKGAEGRIRAIGNAAGTGAIMALLSDEYKNICETIAKTGQHVELGSNPVFFERYIENMYF